MQEAQTKMNVKKTTAETKGPETISDSDTKNDEYTAEDVVVLAEENMRLKKALAAKLGVDASLAEVFADQERMLVQFTQPYACAGIVSSIDHKTMLIEAYQVQAGEIGLLPESEVKRLQKKEHERATPLLITDRSKFTDMLVYRRQYNARTNKAEDVLEKTITPAEQIDVGKLFG